MTNLYVIIKSLLFPGAYLRCFWEQVACRICAIPVDDNRYLRDDEMTSHVEHEFAPTAGKAFAVCFLPWFFTSIAGLFLAIIPAMVMFVLETDNILLTVFSALSWWLSVSIFCNKYPSIENAINMREKLYKKGNVFQKIIFSPGFALLYVGAYLERYLVTFLLAVIATVAFVIM